MKCEEMTRGALDWKPTMRRIQDTNTDISDLADASKENR